MNPPEVLGVGAPFWDSILPVPEAFVASLTTAKGGVEMIDADTFGSIIAESGAEVTVTAGGSAANVIKGLAKLGHRCALLGKVGADEPGRLLEARLRELGIVPHLLRGEGPTGRVIALVTPDGQRTLRDFLGASCEMDPDDLTPEIFAGLKWVHIEGYTLLQKGVTGRAMQLATEAGARISFDLANFELLEQYREEIAPLLAQHVHILFSNAEEAKVMTGRNPEEACKLLRNFCEISVVTMSEKGCWVADRTGENFYPAFPVKPLDSTGAGDLFAAGFLHGYLCAAPLAKCAEYGARVAAAVVQVLGAEIPAASWKELLLVIDS